MIQSVLPLDVVYVRLPPTHFLDTKDEKSQHAWKLHTRSCNVVEPI